MDASQLAGRALGVSRREAVWISRWDVLGWEVLVCFDTF